MENYVILLLVFFAAFALFVYYNAKTDPKIIAEKEAKDAQLKEIYSKMTDDQLVVIGVKTPEEVRNTKLNAIYAKLSEDEIAVIKELITEKKKKDKMEENLIESEKRMNDNFEENNRRYRSSLMYSHLPCNINYKS